MKNELIQRLAADLAISTKTTEKYLNQILTEYQIQTSNQKQFFTEALTDQELFIVIADTIRQSKRKYKPKFQSKIFNIPTTEIFTNLFDLQYLKAKRENKYQWYAYFQSEDGKQKFSFQIPEQDIVETELTEKYLNPFNRPEYKLIYIGLCSIYEFGDTDGKQISFENLYRACYNHKQKINKNQYKQFLEVLKNFLTLCVDLNNSFTCYYYGKKQTLDFNGILSFTISRDGLTINDVPSLLRHARSRKRIAGVNRQLVSSGKAETMLQRLYIAYRMTLAKNQNNRMSANIESSSIQKWCGCAASEKVVKKSFILLQQQKQIREFSISRSRLGFKIEVEV